MKVLILLKRLFNNQAYVEIVPHMLVVSDISGMRIEKINSLMAIYFLLFFRIKFHKNYIIKNKRYNNFLMR